MCSAVLCPSLSVLLSPFIRHPSVPMHQCQPPSRPGCSAVALAEQADDNVDTSNLRHRREDVHSCDICRSISRTGIPAAAARAGGRVQQDPEGHPPTLLWGLAGPVEDKARPTGAPACPPPSATPTPPSWPGGPSHHPSRCYAAALAAVELGGYSRPIWRQ